MLAGVSGGSGFLRRALRVLASLLSLAFCLTLVPSAAIAEVKLWERVGGWEIRTDMEADFGCAASSSQGGVIASLWKSGAGVTEEMWFSKSGWTQFKAGQTHQAAFEFDNGARYSFSVAGGLRDDDNMFVVRGTSAFIADVAARATMKVFFGTKLFFTYDLKGSSAALAAVRKCHFERARDAADAGDTEAAVRAGGLHSFGEGTPKDPTAAVRYFRAAAEKGNVKGQMLLAGSYAEGYGIERDLERALVWYRRAEAQGDTGAAERIGEMEVALAAATPPRPTDETSSREAMEAAQAARARGDEDTAFAFFLHAARLGVPQAQYEVGYAYLNGTGTSRDASEAFYWHDRAARVGHHLAQRRVALAYESGRGVARNLTLAADWYGKAIETARSQSEAASAQTQRNRVLALVQVAAPLQRPEDMTSAQALEAARVAKGRGDDDAALGFYLRAAELGVPLAQYEAGNAYLNGVGTTKNAFQAFYWHERAAKVGYYRAQRRLGVAYERGEGIARDLAEAARWFGRAAETAQSSADAEWARLRRDRAFAMAAAETEASTSLLDERLAEAEAAYEKNHFLVTLNILVPLADAGNTYALNGLGLLYADGSGVPQDMERARKFWLRSAQQGDAMGQLALALADLFPEAAGWPASAASENDGLTWLSRAALTGRTGGHAELILGFVHTVGYPAKEDKELGLYWLTQSAEKAGNPIALSMLGQLLADKNSPAHDFDQAARLLVRSLNAPLAETVEGKRYFGAVDRLNANWDSNGPWQQYTRVALGDLHAAEGPRQDLGEALTWYRHAARLGDTVAAMKLAEIETRLAAPEAPQSTGSPSPGASAAVEIAETGACVAPEMPSVKVGERRVALVIGNSDYAHWEDLANPSCDANAMAAMLERMDFDVMLGLDLDHASFMQQVRAFREATQEADVTLFYYAGHGLQRDGVSYLVPVDASTQALAYDQDTVSAELIAKYMPGRRASGGERVAIMILDACRTPPNITLAGNFAAGRGFDRLTEQGLAEINVGGVLYAYATSPNTVALDGFGRHSPFTAALLRHLPEADVELEVAMRKVRAHVYDATSEIGTPQSAWVSSNMREEFYFVPSQQLQQGVATEEAAPVTPAPTAPQATASAPAGVVVSEPPQSLLLEASDDGRSGAVPFSGQLYWRQGRDESGLPTLVANAMVPARNLSVSVVIRKNTDASLPATHLMEVNFGVPDSFVGQSIAALPGVLMKNEELVQGTAIVGASARVVENSFLFALSSNTEDIDRNVDLLRFRKWLDLALIYGSGKRAIITLEKDASAQALFDGAFAAWDQTARGE